jgi:hypothetical protein
LSQIKTREADVKDIVTEADPVSNPADDRDGSGPPRTHCVLRLVDQIRAAILAKRGEPDLVRLAQPQRI